MSSNGDEIPTVVEEKTEKPDVSLKIQNRTNVKRERPTPYQRMGNGSGPRKSNQGPPFNRLFVSNIAYEEKWQALKDLFREKIGEVTYVELFTDNAGRSRGYGVIEFSSKELCEEACKKMHQYELNGRKLMVREDYYGDLAQRMLLKDGHPAATIHGTRRGHAPQLPPMPPPMRGPPMGMHPMPGPARGNMGNGGIPPPIGKTVFVANLDYKVTYAKLMEVFQLAGKVTKIDLLLDKDNKSRGMANVAYEDHMGAAQAISMLHNQKLFDRPMMVKMDNNSKQNELPSGLSGLGPALNSMPLRDIPPPSMYGAPTERILGDFGSNTNQLAAGLSVLTQQASRLSETLQQSNRGPSMNLPGLSIPGLNELARLGMGGDGMERARLGAQTNNNFSDRQRIEMEIARADNRIRDLDRSLVAATERGHSIPTLPLKDVRGNTQGCTVFVRNLPYSLTWQKLKEKFVNCGSVLFCEIKMVDGKSRGFGHVRFENPSQALEACRAMHGIVIDGRKIEVHIDNRGFR